MSVFFLILFSRLLFIWLGNIKGISRTWNRNETCEISAFLLKCNQTLPSEIHRCIRSLDHINYWKGTEYRTVLLYVGVVVFKDYLSQDEYAMFLKLFCAVTICSANLYSKYLPLARTLFIKFIVDHISIFGEGSVTSNIHNISHVVDDVEHFGQLSTISAYEFENCLHHIKLQLKQCRRPLEQIARRIAETALSDANAYKMNEIFPQLKHSFTLFDNSAVLAFRHITFDSNAVLSSVKENIKDKWFLTHDNSIVEFDYVVRDETREKFMIWGSALIKTESFFQSPFNSNYLNIFMSDGKKSEPQYYEMSVIKAKMFSLGYQTKLVFIPLLHTLQ